MNASLNGALDDRRIESPFRREIAAEKALDKKTGPRIILNAALIP